MSDPSAGTSHVPHADTRDTAAAHALAELAAVVRLLRRECPWDREQTLRTIMPFTLEETWEVADAIEQVEANGAAALPDLVDELGDLLFQVYFLALLAEERNENMTLARVATGIRDKLIRRHPHVFGSARADDADAVRATWDEVKRTEAAERAAAGEPSAAASQPLTLADGSDGALPATLRARKVQKRAAAVGFDFSDPRRALDKLKEEVAELDGALGQVAGQNVGSESAEPDEALVAEAGDVLFAAINVLRLMRVDPEISLHGATRRFTNRVESAARLADQDGISFSELDLDAQEAYYQRAKAALES